MTAQDSSGEYDDAELLTLLANLNLDLENIDRPPPTPSPPTHHLPDTKRLPHHAHHRPDHPHILQPLTPSPLLAPAHLQPRRSTRLYTNIPRLADAVSLPIGATQGVPGATVHAVQSGHKKSKRGKKAAYVVFCGRRCGIFRTWSETKALVSGVPNCIFRGYSSLAAARAAYTYTESRMWTRVTDVVALPIPVLPQPSLSFKLENPLNGDHTDEDRWYVVYRGIRPGVYRSHLESQLNTLGIRGCVHESLLGRAAAFSKYAAAERRGDIAVLTPTYSEESTDPFL
ncbi:hypothetical protein DFH09DRAFT_1320602 [Mycena vulgaris]|nr:hypothetical protein DFH09DRAFT_1320602 [Mycena vulgaris]